MLIVLSQTNNGVLWIICRCIKTICNPPSLTHCHLNWALCSWNSCGTRAYVRMRLFPTIVPSETINWKYFGIHMKRQCVYYTVQNPAAAYLRERLECRSMCFATHQRCLRSHNAARVHNNVHVYVHRKTEGTHIRIQCWKKVRASEWDAWDAFRTRSDMLCPDECGAGESYTD